MKSHLLIALLLSCLTIRIPLVVAGPPKMLLQEKTAEDKAAPSGARVGYAIMRLPDGGFAFYDRHRPLAGPLTLPDRSGAKHTLLPYLPPEILKSKSIASRSSLEDGGSWLKAETRRSLDPYPRILLYGCHSRD